MKSKTLLATLVLAICAPAQTTNPGAVKGSSATRAVAPAVPPIAPLLDGLQQAAQAATNRLIELRIDKWKGSSADKDRYQENSQALQRNMVYALPEIISEVRRAPEDLSSNFKLYRNLDALHDVLAGLAAAASEGGRGDDYRDLAEQTSERTVRPLGCFYWGKVWTMAAWCEHRNDFRSFRVDRVSYVRRLDERFRDEPGRTLADLARLDREWSQTQGWAA